jgi:hypothetical protein
MAALVGGAALAGCSSSSASPSSVSAAPSAVPSPTAGQSLTIYHEDNAQVELISSAGRRILIDVTNKTLLSKPATADDILLTTHGHPDHYDAAFVDSFPGKKITFTEGTLSADGISIVSIPAAHDEGLTITPTGSSDYIFVIDFAGFRIGHFGDLGQNKISDEQMAKIGKIDIAFSQLYNTFSSMDGINKKGFNQMTQVKPLIFVPTHFNIDTAQLASTTWKATFSVEPVTVHHDKLPTETTVLFLGTRSDAYGTMFNLAAPAW